MVQALTHGNREWVHRKFFEYGLESMEPQEVMEMLLQYSAPGKGTYPLAYQIIDRFQGFENVMGAELEILLDTPGISRETAMLIRLTAEMHRYVGISKAKSQILANRDQMIQFLRPHFLGLNHERLYMLCMDAVNRVLGLRLISKGNSEHTRLTIPAVAREAVRTGALRVAIAHNHPYGSPMPSPADITATVNIQKALDALGIRLIDHIIFANGEEYTLRACGLVHF
jgi:DNA repair protein RadC